MIIYLYICKNNTANVLFLSFNQKYISVFFNLFFTVEPDIIYSMIKQTKGMCLFDAWGFDDLLIKKS